MHAGRERVVVLTTALVALLSASTARAQDAEARAADEEERRGFGFAGLPLVNYDSDEGVGYGARVALYDYGENERPYRRSLVLQFFQTTRSVAYHRIIVDVPRAGWDTRVDGEVILERDRFAPYYGLGNVSVRRPALSTCDDRDALRVDPDVCPGNPEFVGLRYNVFSLTSPQTVLNLRRTLDGPWQAFAGHRFKVAKVETRYPDDLGQTRPSKLEEDVAAGAPLLGVERDADGDPRWTRNGELLFGVVYDTRDVEASPSRGQFHTLNARLAGPPVGGEFWYWGANLTLKAYVTLVGQGRLVFAQRLLADVMAGEVPFYQLPTTGGLDGAAVLGGLDSLRGILKNRHLGEAKLISNSELRWRVFTVRPFDQRLDTVLLGGFDVGRVWRELGESDGELFRGDSGATLGLRLAYNQDFIVRVDYARGLTEDTTGVYITFDHLF
jgi:hypothetical protein